MNTHTKPPPGSKNIQLIGAMDRAGLNQKTLADRTGLNRSTINKLVVGRRKPFPTTAALLAAALGVTVEEIFIHGVISRGKSQG